MMMKCNSDKLTTKKINNAYNILSNCINKYMYKKA